MIIFRKKIWSNTWRNVAIFSVWTMLRLMADWIWHYPNHMICLRKTSIVLLCWWNCWQLHCSKICMPICGCTCSLMWSESNSQGEIRRVGIPPLNSFPVLDVCVYLVKFSRIQKMFSFQLNELRYIFSVKNLGISMVLAVLVRLSLLEYY